LQILALSNDDYLVDLENILSAICDDEDIQVIAANDKNAGAVILANMSDEDKCIEIALKGITAKTVSISTTTAQEDNAKTQMEFNSVLKVTLNARAIMQIKLD